MIFISFPGHSSHALVCSAIAAWSKSLQLKSPSGPGAFRRIRAISCSRRQAQVSWTPNFDRIQSAEVKSIKFGAYDWK